MRSFQISVNAKHVPHLKEILCTCRDTVVLQSRPLLSHFPLEGHLKSKLFTNFRGDGSPSGGAGTPPHDGLA